MKTVSGKVLSTKPISLSKAAKILSNFVTVETGASQAVLAYLRRSSVSFSELVQFHKELKGSKSDRRIKNHTAGGSKCQDPVKLTKNLEENNMVRDAEDSVNSAGKMHKLKKKKRKSGEVSDGEIVDLVEQSNLTTDKKKRRRTEGKD